MSTSFRHPAQPLPYVAAWHQAPVSDPLREHAYLHLQVSSIQRAADKLKYLAGSETGMGAFITDVLPEDVADRFAARMSGWSSR